MTVADDTREITLTQGQTAIVDAADYAWVSQYKWCAMRTRNTVYAVRGTKQGLQLLHRFILGLEKGDPRNVDHVDENGLNNCRSNLRIAMHSPNGANTSRVSGQSRYKGVSPGWRAGKWRAGIKVRYRAIHLGTFNSEEDAARAYDEAAKEYFGEFANTNF